MFAQLEVAASRFLNRRLHTLASSHTIPAFGTLCSPNDRFVDHLPQSAASRCFRILASRLAGPGFTRGRASGSSRRSTAPLPVARGSGMRMMKREIDHSERDRLVVSHIGLVKAMAAPARAARCRRRSRLPILISIGVLGLMDAAGATADARRAVRRVRAAPRAGAMLDALRELDWAPRSLRKMRRELDLALARAAPRAQPRADRGGDCRRAQHVAAATAGRSISSATLELGAVRPHRRERRGRLAAVRAVPRPGRRSGVRLAARGAAELLARAIASCPSASAQSWRCTTRKR